LHADGTFQIAGVVDHLGLGVVTPGRVPSKYWTGTIRPGVTTEVVIEAGARADQGRVRLMIPELDEPLPEGSYLQFEVDGLMRLPARVGADGWVALDHLDPGRAVKLVLWPIREPGNREGWLTAHEEVSLSPLEWRVEPTVEVDLSCRLSFRVLGGAGAPLPQFPLKLEGPGDSNRATPLAGLTMADGTWAPFSQSTRAGGAYRLLDPSDVEIWSGTISGTDARRVDVQTLDWEGLRLHLQAGSDNRACASHVSAVVVPLDTLPGTLLTAPPSSTPFQEDMYAQVYYPKRGADRLILRLHQKYLAARDIGPVGQLAHSQPVEIDITGDGGVVRFRVTARSGAASPDSLILLSRADGQPGFYSCRTGQDGTATIVAVSPGVYRYEVRAGRLREPVQHVGLDVLPARITEVLVQ
jgi:hypothetical protein